jgi:hypothetical protein
VTHLGEVASNRRLERAAGDSWLTERFAADFKTIVNFRSVYAATDLNANLGRGYPKFRKGTCHNTPQPASAKCSNAS